MYAVNVCARYLSRFGNVKDTSLASSSIQSYIRAYEINHFGGQGLTFYNLNINQQRMIYWLTLAIDQDFSALTLIF